MEIILLTLTWPRNRLTAQLAVFTTIAVNVVIWGALAASIAYGARYGWSVSK